MPLKTSPTKQRKTSPSLPSEAKVRQGDSKRYRESAIPDEYMKYFTAPEVNPHGFQILDLTDGGSVNTSSHT